MLLYIHVPFCRRKCAYCAFYSVPLPGGRAGADLAGAYLAGVLGELRQWGERLGAPPVETVFFGGGTPSLLPARAVGGVLEAAARRFTLAATAETSAEANPDSALEDGWLFEARRAGLTRLSLGVQSFDDRRLALLGRPHDARTAEAAFYTSRSAGFGNVSLDLMWGLPEEQGRPQAQMQWLAELQKAVELQPEHISAYGFTVEDETPLAAGLAEERFSLPDEKAAASMYLTGAEYLQSHGYMQYEISNYSRPGFECRHNLGYWRGEEYLGIGPAAASTLGGKRWTNPRDIDAWLARVRRDAPPEDTEPLDDATVRKEQLMLGLRTIRGIALNDWNARWGGDFLKTHASLVTLLQKEGLAATRQGHFRLTRTGMLVSDAILAHFFDQLDSA